MKTQSSNIRPLLQDAPRRGYVDDVIMPHATCPRIARVLAMLRADGGDAGRKHDNLPV
jgi:propionyl-CoA carboxylase beta chain